MADPELHTTAFDSRAPTSERVDAHAQLTQAQGLGSLIPADELKPIIDYIENDLATGQILTKASNNTVVPFPLSRQKSAKSRGMQSVYLDEHQVITSGQYYEPSSSFGFDTLRKMVDQTPVLNAVIMTRIRQISGFCRPQEAADTPGFEIRHIDPSHQLSDDEEKTVKLLTRFVNHCGWQFNPRRRQRLKRDSFTEFISKLVRDSLTLDSAAIETEMKRNRKHGIDGFYALDGGSIRLCTEAGYEGDDELFAVQVIQGQVRTVYSYEDLIYSPRNPRTDVLLGGYGLAETELLVRVVTGFLNALTMNIKGFDENSIPRGVMHLSGDYSQDDLTAFKRYWNAQVKGINNSWTVPVLVSKDQESRASFEKFGIEFNEMFFSKWMTFLTSIICAVYSMSPDEINFESFSAQKSSLSGEDTAEKLASSKDKGLRPLMSYLESLISDYIIADFSDNYVFRFVGLDPGDQKRTDELQGKILTVNEMRAQEGFDKWPGESNLGSAPLNPNLVGVWQAEQQQGEEDQDSEDFGQLPPNDTEDKSEEQDQLDNDEQGEADQDKDDEDADDDKQQEDEPTISKAFTIYTVE